MKTTNLKACSNIINCLRNIKASTIKRTKAVVTPHRKAMFDLGVLVKNDDDTISINKTKLSHITAREVYDYMRGGGAPRQEPKKDADDTNAVYLFLESIAVRSARISGVVKPSQAVSSKQIVDICSAMKNKNATSAVALVAPTIDRFFTNIESGVFGISNPIKES